MSHVPIEDAVVIGMSVIRVGLLGYSVAVVRQGKYWVVGAVSRDKTHRLEVNETILTVAMETVCVEVEHYCRVTRDE